MINPAQPLKCIARAVIMVLFSFASISTFQLQLSHQGRCSWMLRCSRPLQNAIYFRCSTLAYFLFLVCSQIASTYESGFKLKQSLSRCECRRQIWVTFKKVDVFGKSKKTNRYWQQKLELRIKTCGVNPAFQSSLAYTHI